MARIICTVTGMPCSCARQMCGGGYEEWKAEQTTAPEKKVEILSPVLCDYFGFTSWNSLSEESKDFYRGAIRVILKKMRDESMFP